MKVYVTDEKVLIMEPSLKWAAHPNVLGAVKAFGLKATAQLVLIGVHNLVSGFHQIYSLRRKFDLTECSFKFRPPSNLNKSLKNLDKKAAIVTVLAVAKMIKAKVEAAEKSQSGTTDEELELH